VWSTLGAVAMGTVGVVAALVFGASLHSLTSTPAEYGWTWDVADFGPSTTARACPTDASRRGATAVASLCYRTVSVQGNQTNAWALRPVHGRVDPPIVAGRAPTAPDEVAIGADLTEATGATIGDDVRIAGDGPARRFRVVGRSVLPGIGDPQPLAGTVLVSARGLERLGGAEDDYEVFRLGPDADRAAFLRELDRRDGDVSPAVATLPAEIDRIQQIHRIPVLLALLTAAVALTAVAFTLVVSVHRRGRDLAILKTIGFDRLQVRATVAWQATTLAVAGVAVGLVLGLVIGRLVWREVADGLGVGTGATVPVAAVVLVLPLAVLIVNAIGALPARMAARTPPAVVLRSE
jgi:hypothetical protein